MKSYSTTYTRIMLLRFIIQQQKFINEIAKHTKLNLQILVKSILSKGKYNTT